MSAPLTTGFLAEFLARPGRRWLPGLGAAEIAALEAEHGLRLPDDARLLLGAANGLAGDERFYSRPRDAAKVRELFDFWRSIWPTVEADLADQGAPLPSGCAAFPLYGHRGVLCSGDPSDSRVLSIVENDAIVYAPSLREWLDLEFPRR